MALTTKNDEIDQNLAKFILWNVIMKKYGKDSHAIKQT